MIEAPPCLVDRAKDVLDNDRILTINSICDCPYCDWNAQMYRLRQRFVNAARNCNVSSLLPPLTSLLLYNSSMLEANRFMNELCSAMIGDNEERRIAVFRQLAVIAA